MEKLQDIIKIPSREETALVYQGEVSITEQYVKRQAYYRFFASLFIEEKLGLSRLDHRLAECNFSITKEKNYYQKYECTNMKYLYLRSYIHIERLTKEEQDILDKLEESQGETEIKKTVDLIEGTWRKVLELDNNFPERMIEVYPSLDGSGRYKGKTILIGLSSEATYDTSGNLADKEQEDRRVRTMLSVAKQLEKIASGILQTEVGVVVEV